MKTPIHHKLFQVGFLFFIVFSVTMTGCQAVPKPLVSDPGVVSFTFRSQFSEDMPGTLDTIKGMGITNIEFSSLFGRTPAEIRQMLDARGMVCTSFGVGYQAVVNNIEQVVENAKILGAKYVRVASIPRQGQFTLEDAQKTVEDFNRAGKILHDNDIYFCYHNHGFEFVPHGDGTLFDYLIQNTDPRYVSFQLDTYWTIHPGANPVELLERYPERFRLMHMKDLKKGVVGDLSGSTSRDNDVVLGTGQVDWPTVLRAAQNSNIEYYYIEDETPDVLERVPVSREYIMSIKQ